MGATLIHGRSLEIARTPVQTPDGASEFCEIVPVGTGGNYEFLLRSSVEALMASGEAAGIDRDAWPVYVHDDWHGRDDWDWEGWLADVSGRCGRLRGLFRGLPPRALAESKWLSLIAGWLREGQDFCILV